MYFIVFDEIFINFDCKLWKIHEFMTTQISNKYVKLRVKTALHVHLWFGDGEPEVEMVTVVS